jgi:uncharacterized protein DUF5666
MRRNTLRLSLAAFTLVGFFGTSLAAQETKSARGIVTAMAGDSISVKAGEREMKFVVDAKSVVTAEGAGTASREAAAAGKSLKLADVVKVGDSVDVSYHETGGTMHAARIRKIPPIGAGGGGVSDDRPSSDSAMGTVQSVSATSLTITGSAGGSGKFSQTFSIDTNTKVVASGAGTAAAAAKEKGKSMGITDYVATGDQVTVFYQKKGDALLATQVRVTRKAGK